MSLGDKLLPKGMHSPGKVFTSDEAFLILSPQVNKASGMFTKFFSPISFETNS